MGTHPIFESDFDCLTDEMSEEQALEKSKEEYELLNDNISSLTPNSPTKQIIKYLTRGLRYIRVIDQDDNISRDLINQHIRFFGQDWLREHDDKGVLIATACYLVQAFRLFIPNLPPFCEEEDGTDSNEKLADTLKFIIRQIPLVNESHYADKAWYMIERIAGLKLIHSALAIEEDEDDETSYSNEVIELLLKTILKSSSNKHDETQSGYFISIISSLFIEGDLEDFVFLDILLSALVHSNQKMNPMASKLVKHILDIWKSTPVEKTILRYFIALFERVD